MKLNMKWFGGAEKIATLAICSGKKAISYAALVLLFLAILSSSGCIGLTGAPKPAASQQSTPGAAVIAVAPASVSFGQVAVGGTASQSVTISNTGGASLMVTQASTTAAGVNITGISLPQTIAAGTQSTFDVVFSPKAAGALSGNISVMSNLSASPDMVSLSGTAMAATTLLSSSASSLGFGNVTIGKSSSLSVTLTNAGNSEVTVSKVTVSGTPYSVGGVSAGLILAPGQSATLDATFSPAASGSLPGSVTVASNATNSPATVSLSGDGVQASVSHSVTLSWTPSSSSVVGYNVYRSEVSGGTYSPLESSVVAADTYTDSTVLGGLTYYYVITSVSSSGVQSADSAQASATIPTL